MHIKDSTSGQSNTVTKVATFQYPFAGSSAITSPAEVKCHRKVKLNETIIYA